MGFGAMDLEGLVAPHPEPLVGTKWVVIVHAGEILHVPEEVRDVLDLPMEAATKDCVAHLLPRASQPERVEDAGIPF